MRCRLCRYVSERCPMTNGKWQVVANSDGGMRRCGLHFRDYVLRGAPLVVLWLAVLFIYRYVLVGRVLAGGDLQMYFFPYWTAAARAFQSGRIPLWSPYLFTGVPLLANSQVGVAYPLNWLLWWLSGPTVAGMARTLHWSVLLHVSMAAFTTYTLVRCLGAHPWGAVLSGLLYAGGGYVGLHLEHLNQLQALAWLPLVFLPNANQRARSSWLNVFSLAMILLAGHTQMAFIAGVGLVLWWLGANVVREKLLAVRGWVLEGGRFFLPFTIAVLIAAVQLLPTLELMSFSMRSGGLPWREAVSFSIRPWDLPEALLPPYWWPPLLPEGVAYVGLIGLGLAIVGMVFVLRQRVREGWSLLFLAGGGLFLALGGYNPLYLLAVRIGVPGLVHFRAPARFLALYVLAVVIFAGYGVTGLVKALSVRDSARWWRYAAVVLVGGGTLAELTSAAQHLPHTSATALRAYTDMRPATAHLIAATRATEAANELPERFLSISKTLFDAGDEIAMAVVYGHALSDAALWSYQVAAKHREVLSPNLSLVFQVPAVDGYDGGVLPLRHYVNFSRLLLPEGTLDGRLRENLTSIPDARWLSLLGVRFVITDKTGDAWAEDVFYDRQFQVQLAVGDALTLAWLPTDFVANALGLLYTGSGFADIVLADGQILHLPLSAFGDTVGRVRWPRAEAVTQVILRANEGGLHLAGASLIDERTGAFYPLTLSAHFRQVHSGDVKVYENLAVLPRVFWVDSYQCLATDTAALTHMQLDAFRPASQAVLSACAEDIETQSSNVSLVPVSPKLLRYDDESLVFEIETTHPGLVVVTDAWYPGWRARLIPLDKPNEVSVVPVLRADVLFRAVQVPAGRWRVVLAYRSWLVYGGAIISLLGIGVLIVYGGWGRWRDWLPRTNDE